MPNKVNWLRQLHNLIPKLLLKTFTAFMRKKIEVVLVKFVTLKGKVLIAYTI